MAYTNLPPNLYDYFSTVNQRIRKLESAPDQAMTTATSAQGVSSQALTAANLANTQATTAIALANTKNTVFYSGTAPTANAVNDQWIDTALGNKLYIWDGSTWTSAQDAAINAAQTTANGKNAIYRQGSTPTGGTYAVGDMWFNTSSDNAISTWNGSAWAANALGTNALANFSANKITSGTIDASVVNVSNINAGNISSGYLASSRIQTGSLNANVITSNTITATQIAAGTITATEISSSYVYAGTINANNITTGTLSASVSLASTSGTIGGFNISTYALTAGGLSINSSSGQISSSSSITTSSLTHTNTLTVDSTATMNGNMYYSGHSSSGSGGDLPIYQASSTGYLYAKSSSKRFKQDIQSQDIPIADVLLLNPVTYVSNEDYKANNNSAAGLKRVTGLIAEEVALIDTLKDLVVGYDDNNEPFSIAYDAVAVALIPAIKNLNTRLAKLEGANGNTTPA